MVGSSLTREPLFLKFPFAFFFTIFFTCVCFLFCFLESLCRFQQFFSCAGMGLPGLNSSKEGFYGLNAVLPIFFSNQVAHDLICKQKTKR